MNYTEAIEWLREHDVKKDDGTYYEFGEVTTNPDSKSALIWIFSHHQEGPLIQV